MVTQSPLTHLLVPRNAFIVYYAISVSNHFDTVLVFSAGPFGYDSRPARATPTYEGRRPDYATRV